MKLELKHLSAYLPYGLKGFYMDADYDKQIEFEGLYIYEDIYNSEHGDMSFDYFKPILRPLSYLKKEIEVNGEKLIPIVKLFDEIIYETDEEFYRILKIDWQDCELIKSAPYRFMEKLFEWHLDVFGLIEKGLAIDINTLNK